MSKFKQVLVFLPVMAFLVVLTAPAAQAASVSIDLTIDHCTGGCGPAGTIFGTVTLTQNGTTVDVTVHLNSPYLWAKTGAADFQAFKFNATGVAVPGDITVDQTFVGKTLVADAGAFNGDGTGAFSYGIACTDCGNGLSPPTHSNDIVFHVANAFIADLTAANSSGFIFAADIGNSLTGATGPVAAATPEPASILLLGSALVGLGFVRKRARRE